MDQQQTTPTPTPAQGVPGAAPAASQTDTLGIISLVCAFIGFQLPGFIIGLIGVKKAKEEGRSATLSKIGWILNLVFMILFIGFVILFIALGALGTNKAKTTVDKWSKQAENAYSAQVSSKKDFAKGETAKFGDLSVVITNVTRNYVPSGSFFKPKAGNEFIVLDISIANNGKESTYISPFYFPVDEAGVRKTDSFVTAPGKELESVQLASGASTSGQIVYEVTSGASGLKLVKEDSTYNPSTAQSEKVTYTLAF